MAGADDRSAGFVPTSFEELKRNSSRAPLPDPEERITSRDLHDLVAERGFMRQSGLIAAGAAAVGALMILVAYARPLLQTLDAFHTSGRMVADSTGQQMQAVQGAAGDLARQAAFVRATDEKAINTARGGIGCLTGKAACPNGASPFR